MKQLAIFASGAGSNAKKIIEHFTNHPSIRVSLVVSNNPDAGVLDIAKAAAIPSRVVAKGEIGSAAFERALRETGITSIILAGWLKLVPESLIKAYPENILNIHPALLPAYGGKGMYGMNVHRAVAAAGEPTSGMTIHLINEHYDKGRIIFQKSCALDAGDSAEAVAAKVLQLEHKYYPAVIESFLSGSPYPQ